MSGEGKFLGVVSEFMNDEFSNLVRDYGDGARMVVRGLYEETTSMGYCDTCYTESTEAVISYDVVGGDGKVIASRTFTYCGNMAEFITSLMKY